MIVFARRSSNISAKKKNAHSAWRQNTLIGGSINNNNKNSSEPISFFLTGLMGLKHSEDLEDMLVKRSTAENIIRFNDRPPKRYAAVQHFLNIYKAAMRKEARRTARRRAMLGLPPTTRGVEEEEAEEAARTGAGVAAVAGLATAGGVNGQRNTGSTVSRDGALAEHDDAWCGGDSDYFADDAAPDWTDEFLSSPSNNNNSSQQQQPPNSSSTNSSNNTSSNNSTSNNPQHRRRDDNGNGGNEQQQTSPQLKILGYNCLRLSDLNLYYLRRILDEQTYDIVMVSESRLHDLVKLHNQNYQIFAQDFKQQGAQGTILVVRSTLKTFKVEIAAAADKNITTVKVICDRGKHLILMSVYIPPVTSAVKDSRHDTVLNFATTLSYLTEQYATLPIVIYADLNAKCRDNESHLRTTQDKEVL